MDGTVASSEPPSDQTYPRSIGSLAQALPRTLRDRQADELLQRPPRMEREGAADEPQLLAAAPADARRDLRPHHQQLRARLPLEGRARPIGMPLEVPVDDHGLVVRRA